MWSRENWLRRKATAPAAEHEQSSQTKWVFSLSEVLKQKDEDMCVASIYEYFLGLSGKEKRYAPNV